MIYVKEVMVNLHTVGLHEFNGSFSKSRTFLEERGNFLK